MIENIRKKFFKEFSKNPEYYTETDVTRVRNEDWIIERFLKDNDNSEDRAYDELVRTLKWKRLYGIHDRTDQYFPKEFYDLHHIEIYGRDRDGRLVHWETTRNLVKINDFTPLEQQFLGHRLEKLDSLAGRAGWTLVTDCSGSGLPNVSLEMWRFRIDLLQYYPQAVGRILIVDLPPILAPIMRIILSMMPPKLQRKATLVTRQQLTRYIDPEYIPRRMAGGREDFVRSLMDVTGLKPMDQLTHLPIKDRQIELYRNKHQMIIKRTRLI
ncbi:motile sperm domain-containing protein 2-like [Oppia nitens]|uniref:motile sperm domain-containing protein 2-like n=1 Tax=Oppia nitens TaxID=1686743 RepID=UPI0023DCBEB8|nr:motile sperm domain-containing protein 2-like [Oppia nitens]